MSASALMQLGLFAVIILLFAAWVTVHVQLCVILLRTSPAKGLLSFVIVPLAPYWAHRAKVPKLPQIWITLAALYSLALIAGLI